MSESTKDGSQRKAKLRGRLGNDSALRHGLKGSKLPDGCKYVELRINKLRRTIEALVVEVKGSISFVDAATINSIIRWERHGMLAAHWLRKMIDKLSPADRLRFSEAMAKAGDARDKNIKMLGIDRDQADDLINSLYARPRLLPGPKEEAS
jgi:hypothetical protein